jgi:N-acetylgalactosamine-6-sulfatase
MRFHVSVLPLVLGVVVLGGCQAEAPPGDRPNIVLILADDMGWADPSSFGGTAIPTPHIDGLAAGGMRFTQFYAGSAVCTPTRASILTGRYPLRFGITAHFADDEAHLPRGTVTLPMLLQGAGYATAHVGKWHLGGLHLKHAADRAHSIPGPREHGFEHYQTQNEEQPLRGGMGEARTLYREGGTCLLRDEKPVGPADPYYEKHFTDANGDYALEMIERFHDEGRPFFLNVWWLVPHTPYEPAPEPHWEATAAEGISDDQHRFRSMVAHMDARVGQIVAKLEALGIRDQTLILFTSDNGGAYEADVGGLKGGKTDLHEGGIRVPTVLNWHGHVPPGTSTDAVGHTNDILPTLCAAAGVEVPPGVSLDGIDLLPHVVHGSPLGEAERGTLFWQIHLYEHLQRHYPKPKPWATEAVRRGKWKLLAREGQPTELFDVEADPFEENNLLGRHPELEASLTAALQAWLAEPRGTSLPE